MRWRPTNPDAPVTRALIGDDMVDMAGDHRAAIGARFPWA